MVIFGFLAMCNFSDILHISLISPRSIFDDFCQVKLIPSHVDAQHLVLIKKKVGGLNKKLGLPRSDQSISVSEHHEKLIPSGRFLNDILQNSVN